MKFSYASLPPSSCDVDSLVMFVPEFGKVRDKTLKELNARGVVDMLLATEEFSGKEEELVDLVHPAGFLARRVFLVGLGRRKDIDADTYRRAAGRLARVNGLISSRTSAWYLGDPDDGNYYQAVVEGYFLGGFEQREFKTGEAAVDKTKLERIEFIVSNKRHHQRVTRAVERGRTIAEGQTLVRRLANTPANHLTPSLLAEQARTLAQQYNIRCTILDAKAIKREKMGALMAVAQGSIEPPRFIVLEYKGARAPRKPIVLVGKGVTFDAGGISLKNALNMHEMRGDMAGAATVLATLVTAARLKLPVNLVGLIPSAENMPSGTAIKPGDIITSRKGLTIEVINTDAEGRLLLADGLDFANKFEPEAVIDIATLTGATLYILGYSGAPILGNHRGLLGRIEQASAATAERVWRLPIWEDHREQMKSSLADLVNSGGRPAGTIAASAFLENFTGDWPWAHIDIAYVDLEPKGKPYIPKGTTGFGVRLLVEVLSRWKKLPGR